MDDKVLSTKEVSSLSAESIDEFVNAHLSQIVSKYSDKGFGYEYSDQEYAKIQRRFGIGESDNQPEQVARVENILKQAVEDHFDEGLVGFILYGSRIDPKKTATEQSDLDILAVFDLTKNTSLLGNNEKILDWFVRAKQNIKDEEGFSFPLEFSDSFISLANLNRLMQLDIQYIPIWAWKSKGFKFIGKEQEIVNERLQIVVKSDNMLQAKAKFIKENFDKEIR